MIQPAKISPLYREYVGSNPTGGLQGMYAKQKIFQPHIHSAILTKMSA